MWERKYQKLKIPSWTNRMRKRTKWVGCWMGGKRMINDPRVGAG